MDSPNNHAQMKRKASGQAQSNKPKMQKQGSAYGPALRRSLEEKKNIDVNNANAVVAAQTGATIFLLNGVTPGTSGTTRVGRRITMTSLNWRWVGALAPTTAGASPIRLLIVYDKQANAAAPGAGDVLVIDAIDSPMNLNNSRRFKILADVEIPCVGTSGPAAWSETGFRDFTAKGTKAGLDVEFNAGTAGTIADIQTGSIYALVYQYGTLITASPTSNLYTRIRFLDA